MAIIDRALNSIGLQRAQNNIGTNFGHHAVDKYVTNPIDWVGILASFYYNKMEQSNSRAGRYLTQWPELLKDLYRLDPITSRYIAQPVDDGFKDGFSIKTDNLEEDENKEITDLMNKLRVTQEVKMAVKMARLYGGGALIIGDADQSKNSQPVSVSENSRIKAIRWWDLSLNTPEQGTSYAYLSPISLKIKDATSIYWRGVKFHPSRILAFPGQQGTTTDEYSSSYGWGLSSVERLVEPLVVYMKQRYALLEYAEKLKLEKVKMQSVKEALLRPNGDRDLRNILGRLNYQRNVSSTILLGDEDDFITETLDLTGVKDLHEQNQRMLCQATGFPAEKLWGNQLSGGGIGGTQDQLEVYNAMVEGGVREPTTQPIMELYQIFANSLYQVELNGLELIWPSLREASDVEMDNMKTSHMNRLNQAIQLGLMTQEEAQQAINKFDLVGVNVDEDGGSEVSSQILALGGS